MRPIPQSNYHSEFNMAQLPQSCKQRFLLPLIIDIEFQLQ